MNSAITMKPTAPPRNRIKQRFHQLDEAFGEHGDFFVVGVGHFVEHRVELARFFADVDHVDDEVVDDALLALRAGKSAGRSARR